MRRLAGISALVVILLCVPVWAQKRGGSVGGRAGFAPRGGVVFHGSFPHTGITIRTFPGPFTHFHRFPYRPFWGYRYPGYYAYGYPGYYGYYGYAGYYDPLLWGSASSYSYDNASNYSASYDQSQQLQQQINRLEDEVDRLKDERYARPAAPPAAAAPATPPKPESATLTVLIFKDQHREEVHNYAVVGRTVWVFSEQRARKIPLDQLNIPATQQANDERGVDFRIPG